MPALDGVRGICMLAVLIGHLTIFGGSGLLFEPRLVNLLGGGDLCLEVFFVLSGALITHLALSEISTTGTIDMRRFRNRRVRRLAPAAILVLVATVVLCVTGLRDEQVPLGTRPTLVVFSVLALSSNWLLFSRANLGYLTPTWSLSVEEQFYLAWPLTLRRTWTRLGPAGSALAALALLIAGLGTSVVLAGHDIYATYATPVAGVALLCGCLVAIGLHSPWAPAMRRMLGSTPLAIALVVSIGFSARWLHLHTHAALRGGYLGFDVATALFIGHLMVRSARPSPMARALGLRPVAYLGRISYGAYLFHATIYQMWDRSGLLPNITVRAIVDVTSALVVASISFHLIEEPIRLGRLHLPHRRRAAPVRPPAAAWARFRFVPQIALGLAAVAVVLQFAPTFHPQSYYLHQAKLAALGPPPGCVTDTVQRAAGFTAGSGLVACEGRWALAAEHSDSGRLELLHYKKGIGWHRLNTEHGKRLDSAAAHATPGKPELTTVQHLASAIGPVAAPGAAAANLISVVAAAAQQAQLPAVVASPVVTGAGQRWLAVLSPATIGAMGPSARLTIYEWQHARWNAVGLVTGLSSAPAGTTYRITSSTLSGTLSPVWLLHAAYGRNSAVSAVADVGGTWHPITLTAPGTGGAQL